MYSPVKAIEVRIWGRRVGALALDPSLGYYASAKQSQRGQTSPKRQTSQAWSLIEFVAIIKFCKQLCAEGRF